MLLNKSTSFTDPYDIVKSNCSDNCNIPIDYDTLLKVMDRDVQGDNDKNTSSAYPKNMTVTQIASTSTSNRVTVTQDASINTCNHFDKGIGSYFELVLKSSKDHIASLENQLEDKQCVIEELL